MNHLFTDDNVRDGTQQTGPLAPDQREDPQDIEISKTEDREDTGADRKSMTPSRLGSPQDIQSASPPSHAAKEVRKASSPLTLGPNQVIQPSLGKCLDDQLPIPHVTSVMATDEANAGTADALAIGNADAIAGTARLALAGNVVDFSLVRQSDALANEQIDTKVSSLFTESRFKSKIGDLPDAVIVGRLPMAGNIPPADIVGRLPMAGANLVGNRPLAVNPKAELGSIPPAGMGGIPKAKSGMGEIPKSKMGKRPIVCKDPTSGQRFSGPTSGQTVGPAGGQLLGSSQDPSYNMSANMFSGPTSGQTVGPAGGQLLGSSQDPSYNMSAYNMSANMFSGPFHGQTVGPNSGRLLDFPHAKSSYTPNVFNEANINNSIQAKQRFSTFTTMNSNPAPMVHQPPMPGLCRPVRITDRPQVFTQRLSQQRMPNVAGMFSQQASDVIGSQGAPLPHPTGWPSMAHEPGTAPVMQQERTEDVNVRNYDIHSGEVSNDKDYDDYGNYCGNVDGRRDQEHYYRDSYQSQKWGRMKVPKDCPAIPNDLCPVRGIALGGHWIPWPEHGNRSSCYHVDPVEVNWSGTSSQQEVNNLLSRIATEALVYGLDTDSTALFIYKHLSKTFAGHAKSRLTDWLGPPYTGLHLYFLRRYLVEEYSTTNHACQARNRWKTFHQRNLTMKSYLKIWTELHDDVIAHEPGTISLPEAKQQFIHGMSPLYTQIYYHTNGQFHQQLNELIQWEENVHSVHSIYPTGYNDHSNNLLEENMRSGLFGGPLPHTHLYGDTWAKTDDLNRACSRWMNRDTSKPWRAAGSKTFIKDDKPKGREGYYKGKDAYAKGKFFGGKKWHENAAIEDAAAVNFEEKASQTSHSDDSSDSEISLTSSFMDYVQRPGVIGDSAESCQAMSLDHKKSSKKPRDSKSSKSSKDSKSLKVKPKQFPKEYAQDKRSFCIRNLRSRCRTTASKCLYAHRKPKATECLSCAKEGHQARNCPKRKNYMKHQFRFPDKKAAAVCSMEIKDPRDQLSSRRDVLNGTADKGVDPYALTPEAQKSERYLLSVMDLDDDKKGIHDLETKTNCSVSRVAPWMYSLDVEKYGEVEAMLDTGASANFMHKGLAVNLVRSKALKLGKLNRGIMVTYGNGYHEWLKEYGILRDRNMQKCIVFLMVKTLSPRVILGRMTISRFPMMMWNAMMNTAKDNSEKCSMKIISETTVSEELPKPIQSESSYPRSDILVTTRKEKTKSLTIASVIQVSPLGRLMVSCPLLENAFVCPFRAAQRSRAGTKQKIIQHLVDQLIKEGKCMKVLPVEAVMIHEIVLVDKWGTLPDKVPAVYPLPEDQLKRWRITLDLVPLNQLRFEANFVTKRESDKVETSLPALLVPTDYLKVRDIPKGPTRQFQANALGQLVTIPLSDRAWYGKIDCRDAFHSVGIVSQLSRLVCFWGPSGSEVYTMTRLPQGWAMSPLYFSLAVGYILDAVRPFLPEHTHCVHYQDDIMIIGREAEKVSKAMEFMIKGLTDRLFEVRPDKCKGPCKKMTFCGWMFEGPSLLPSPSRKEITASYVENEMSKLKKAMGPKEFISIARSWAGVFNYMTKWMIPSAQEKLRSIFQVIKTLNKDIKAGEFEVKKDQIMDLETAVRYLSRYYINEIPFLYLTDEDVKCTIVVVDSNQDGWASVGLMLVRKDQFIDVQDRARATAHENMNGFKELIMIVSQSFPDLIPSVNDVILLPIRWMGGRFEPTQRTKLSSTWRERYGAMYAVKELRPLLRGNVILCCDNKNVGCKWQDAMEHITAGMWSNYLSYLEHVHHFVHVPRTTECIVLIDELARGLLQPQVEECQVKQAKRPRPMSQSEDDVSPVANIDMVTRSMRRSNPENYPKLAIPMAFRNYDLPRANKSMLSESDNLDDSIFEVDVDPRPEMGKPSVSFEANPMCSDTGDWIPLHLDDNHVVIPHPKDSLFTWEMMKNEYTSEEVEKYKWNSDKSYLVYEERIVIPTSRLDDIIWRYHMIGHSGFHACLELIRYHGWYHPSLRSVVSLVIAQCLGCQLSKNNSGRYVADSKLPTAKYAFELMAMDFMHIADGSKSGMNVLVLVDYFSRFVWTLYPESRSSKHIITMLSEVFWQYRFPVRLFSDNAAEFLSAEMENWLSSHSVVRQSTPVYHPSSNGIVERCVRTLTEGLRSTVLFAGPISFDGTQKDLIREALAQVCCRINTTKRRDGETTPKSELQCISIPCPYIGSPQTWGTGPWKARYQVGEQVLVRRTSPVGQKVSKLSPLFNLCGTIIEIMGNHRYMVRIENRNLNSHGEEIPLHESWLKPMIQILKDPEKPEKEEEIQLDSDSL